MDVCVKEREISTDVSRIGLGALTKVRMAEEVNIQPFSLQQSCQLNISES